MSALRAVSRCFPPALSVAVEKTELPKMIVYIPHMREYMVAYADLRPAFKQLAFDRKYYKTLEEALRCFNERS